MYYPSTSKLFNVLFISHLWNYHHHPIRIINREPGNIPFKWINVMREALLTVLPHFSARRMVKEYSNKFYVTILKETDKAR
jgi:glucan phosphorylase